MTSRRGIFAFLAALVAPASLLGCEGEGGPLGGSWSLEAARLEAAVERWNEREPSRYAFDYRQGCFCPPEATTPVRVTVENGEVRSLIYLEDVRNGDENPLRAGDPVPEELGEAFGTVDDVLRRIGQTIQARPIEFEVRYSPEYGYPLLHRAVQCRCPDSGLIEEIGAFESLAP